MKMKAIIMNQTRLLHSEPGAGSTYAGDDGTDDVRPPSTPTPGEEVDFGALSKEFESDDDDSYVPDEPDVPEGTPPAQVPAPAEPSPAPMQPGSVVPPVPAATPPAAVPAASTPPAPGSQPTPPAPDAPAQPTQPAQPGQEPAQQAAPPAQAPEPVNLTPEAIEAAHKQFEANILPQLERNYQLSEEQVTEIQENPGAAIPKLAARIHFAAQMAAYTGIMSQVPGIITTLLSRQREVEKAEEHFFSRWAPLRDPKYADTVDKTLRAYRTANPKADLNDITEKAGLMAMLALGLDPRVPGHTIPGQPPAQPQAQPSVPPAFRPAGTGSSGPARPAQGGASNVFEEMADDMLREDL